MYIFSRQRTIEIVVGTPPKTPAPLGSMMWGGFYEDANALEGTQAKFGADEMLQAVVDEGGHNCQPGAMSIVMRRLG